MAQGRLYTVFHRRVRDWALRRQGGDRLPLTLASRRIYILPTRAGWTFGLLIAVTFIAGMNYGNGLALLFTFWLTGFALVAMVQTQRTLAVTRLRSATAAPAFAGGNVAVSMVVSTGAAAADLVLSGGGIDPSSAAGPSGLLLHVPAPRRGPWRAPPLQLSSTAPFGLFRSWTWLRLDIATLVYPRLAGDLPIPSVAGDGGGRENLANAQDELAWLRDFREGDSPRQVAWKAYARGAPLLVREYRGYASACHEFDFSALHDPDAEVRLSQLARWCVDAAARGEHWTLRLPGTAPMAGTGTAHLEQCLQKLALYGMGSAT